MTEILMTPHNIRGSDGLWMINGPPKIGTRPDFSGDTSNRIKVMTFSRDGSHLAWCNGTKVIIKDTGTFSTVQEFDKPKAIELKFSPQGTILAIWENYTVNQETQKGNPNLHLYNVRTGSLVKSLIQRKQTKDPKWTNDEKICCRNVNNELHFFEENEFDNIKTKLHMQKISDFSLAKSGPPYTVAGYVPGSKGQPSFVRIYRYPNFGGPQAALANKSFYKSDDVQMKWNSTGTALLVLTSTESSEQSYYGDQGLHFMGNLEFWDVGKRRLIAQTQAQDSTAFEWCPDGEHVLTSTTAPRLRVANGYRIWHYTGNLLSQVILDQGKELWETKWQSALPEAYPEKQLNYRPVQTQNQTESKGAYRPPQARGTEASIKLHEYESAYDPKKKPKPGMAIEDEPSKSASKNKKKREARKAKAAQEDATKLQQIEKLKEQQKSGKQLELNQIEKLKTEESLLKELSQLQIEEDWS
ncbi:hypothetical protein KUTeg_018613 [Tegillarca granosa]|uniref:Eukaryotic translation initiation factor 2A n=1 Tax=Tegillarca granosa TaxID=220873 RepID=A0ABQ9EJW9_TEGGR|nr:hypothetical protein KUTeg_018613 [Tegillarca granosa]